MSTHDATPTTTAAAATRAIQETEGRGEVRPESLLSAHATSLDWRDVPDAARTRTTALLADYVASVLAGLRSAQCRRIAAAAIAEGGSAASLVGGGRASLRGAAVANAALAHWFEMDDVHDPGALHIGAVVFPVMIAAAQARGLTGPEAWPEFAAAVVAAIDVCGRIGEAIQPWALNAWMPTGFACPVGAAAGAARLAGLDAAGIASAMGLAAAGGGLLRQPLADRRDGKNVLCAQAAGRAVEAAALASAGIEGAPNFLTGRFGLIQALTGGRATLSGLADLGRRFTASETSLKPFPCCRSTHPAIDLALQLARSHDLAPEAITTVTIDLPEPMHGLVGGAFEPGDDPRVAAQFSNAYTVALALARRGVRLADFEGDVGHDQAIVSLARRVTSVPYALPAGVRALGSRVTLRVALANGEVVEAASDLVAGSPAHPMDAAAVEAKLADAARDALDAPALDALRAALDDLPRRGLDPLLRCLEAARWSTAPRGAAA